MFSRQNIKIFYNNRRIQKIGSNICGKYCLTFAFLISLNINFYDLMEVFYLDNNDQLIEEIWQKYNL